MTRTGQTEGSWLRQTHFPIAPLSVSQCVCVSAIQSVWFIGRGVPAAGIGVRRHLLELLKLLKVRQARHLFSVSLHQTVSILSLVLQAFWGMTFLGLTVPYRAQVSSDSARTCLVREKNIQSDASETKTYHRATGILLRRQ